MVAVAKRQHRRLLAALLAQAGELVSTDALIDVLWPDQPPNQPLVTVHSAIARVRRAMEPERPRGTDPRWLRTEAPGYRLVTADGEVDAERFQTKADRGCDAFDRGDPHLACEQLRAGLAEWRGPALAEFADEPFAVGTARRLEEARIDALEARIAADLACGRNGVVGELEVLVSDHPFRERLWEHLLVALLRSGRQADALRAFQDARRTFAEAGLEPGPRLVEIDAAIARQDPALLDPDALPPPVAPRVRATPAASAPGSGTGVWAAPRVDRPHLATGPAPPFVGRIDEMAWFDGHLGAAGGVPASAAVISGEPGIGKSRLLAEAAGRAAADGALVLVGHCSEDPLLPHEPFVQALGSLVAGADEDALADLGEQRAHLARLLPDEPRLTGAGADPSLVEPETARYLAYRAVSKVLDVAGRDRVTVLVIDDLQWAEASTLRLILHLLGDGPGSGLVLLGAYRDTEVGPGNPLSTTLDDLRQLLPLQERAITGLSRHEVGELVAHWGADPAGPLATQVHHSTDGHPLFVAELVGHLDGGWQPGLPLAAPESLRALIRRRVRRLRPSTRVLLETASLIGRRVDASLLAEALHRDAATVADDLDEATAAGFLTHSGGTLSFAHDLVRDILEELAAPAVTTVRHRAIGDALARRSPDPEPHLAALARHYAAAAADGDPVAAVEYADRAGRQALRLLAHDDALARFRTGLAALEQSDVIDEHGRLNLLIGLLEAQRRTGRTSGGLALGVEALGLARRLGSPAQVADAARGAVSATWDDDDARSALAEALDQALAELHNPDHSSAETAAQLQVMEMLMLVLARLGRHDHAVDLARQIHALAGSVESPDLQVEAMTSAVNVVVNEEPLARRLQVTGDILQIAGRTENRETHAIAYATARYVAIEALDQRADELAAAYETAVDALRMPRYLAGRAQRQAMLAHLAADFERAEAASTEMVAHQPSREFYEAFVAQLFSLRLAQGRVAPLAPVFDELGEVGHRPVWRAARAWCWGELGESDEARSSLAPVIARLDRLQRDAMWLLTLVAAGHASAWSGVPDDADRLLALLRPESHRVVVSGTGVTCLGSVARVLGPLALAGGDADGAAAWCRTALDAHRRLGAPLYEIEDRLWLARSLRAGARAAPDESPEVLTRDALSSAASLGVNTRVVRETRPAADAP